MRPELRDAMFVQQLEPFPEWFRSEQLVTVEEWGTGWDMDGDAYWAVEGYRSRMGAWSTRPSSATHVAVYHK